eukprot:TRINITY_DN34920_c0_g1_i1.p1 TRINITY_DN34920_c0_g1~~TRINITY_DN34920_c0_g1_i1.p1  ORF type:complete len:244 (-),score=29.07 TRINITY_DN34920_c0_g1_i1:779-1510(-)
MSASVSTSSMPAACKSSDCSLVSMGDVSQFVLLFFCAPPPLFAQLGDASTKAPSSLSSAAAAETIGVPLAVGTAFAIGNRPSALARDFGTSSDGLSCGIAASSGGRRGGGKRVGAAFAAFGVTLIFSNSGGALGGGSGFVLGAARGGAKLGSEARAMLLGVISGGGGSDLPGGPRGGGNCRTGFEDEAEEGVGAPVAGGGGAGGGKRYGKCLLSRRSFTRTLFSVLEEATTSSRLKCSARCAR